MVPNSSNGCLERYSDKLREERGHSQYFKIIDYLLGAIKR